MTVAKYPAHAESGIPWLGALPAHWDIVPYKRLVDIQNGADHKHIEQAEGYPVIGSGGVFAYASEFLYEGDSVLLGRKGTIDKPLFVSGRFWTVDTMYWTKIAADANPRFAYYTALTIPFNYYSTNTALPSMTKSVLHAHFVARPPKSEQAEIALFLDHETANIDALVDEQKRLIDLLKEKRQAVISQAVTKGLDPSVPMKDSGVAWLGKVPVHWEVLALRRCAGSVETGGTPSAYPPAADLEDGFTWYTPGDFGDALVLSSSARKVAQSSVESGDAKIFPAGSILVVSIGATLGKVGFAPTRSSANQQINAVIPNGRANGYFLAWSLRAKGEVMRFLSNASTIGIMNQEKTKDIWLALPPISEQVSIASELDRLTQDLDELIAEAQSAVGLLQERRSTLISAAVTGKIDVRRAAAVESSA